MDTDRPSTSTPATTQPSHRRSRATTALLGVFAALAVGVSASSAAGSSDATAAAAGAVFPMDEVQKMVPIDTSAWLSIPDNIAGAPADALSIVDCGELATWLVLDIPDVPDYTRTCSFYQQSLPVPVGQRGRVLPTHHLAGDPRDQFSAQVFYAPPGVDVHHTPTEQSNQQGLLTVWIRDVTTESWASDPFPAWDSNPLDSARGGHVIGTLHGRPASVIRTFGDSTSVATVLPAGEALLAVDMSSALPPAQALTAAEHVLPAV